MSKEIIKMTLKDYCKIIGAQIVFSGHIDPEGEWTFCNVWLEQGHQQLRRAGGCTIYGRTESEPLSLTKAGEDLLNEIRGRQICFGDPETTFTVPEDLTWE